MDNVIAINQDGIKEVWETESLPLHIYLCQTHMLLKPNKTCLQFPITNPFFSQSQDGKNGKWPATLYQLYLIFRDWDTGWWLWLEVDTQRPGWFFKKIYYRFIFFVWRSHVTVHIWRSEVNFGRMRIILNSTLSFYHGRSGTRPQAFKHDNERL